MINLPIGAFIVLCIFSVLGVLFLGILFILLIDFITMIIQDRRNYDKRN